jgi:hypothetical protein
MNQTSSTFLRSLLTKLRTQLELAGFVYKGRSWYEKPLSSDSTGIVTLASNFYPDDPAVYINPSLGVRHERLERLLAELCGQKPTKFLPATIGSSLGYVTSAGKHIMYSFLPDIANDVSGLVGAIEHDGLKWMEANQTAEAILDGLANFKYAPQDRARFRIPLICYFKGDYESTRRWLHWDMYRRFATGLLDRLGRVARKAPDELRTGGPDNKS